MLFKEAMIEARLLRRYKRFLADVELESGELLTVHCPNSGRMTSCSEPGSRVLISDSKNDRRKLRFTLEMVRAGQTWVGVNTARPNAAVEQFLKSRAIPELRGYDEIRREVAVGKSRIDLRLRDSEALRPDCWVEVKNATLRVGEHAAFPDAVSERGRKHLLELAERVAEGERGVIFFFVGRDDCCRFRTAEEVDPAYAETFREVVSIGVEPLAYRVRYEATGVSVVDRLPVDLD